MASHIFKGKEEEEEGGRKRERKGRRERERREREDWMEDRLTLFKKTF